MEWMILAGLNGLMLVLLLLLVVWVRRPSGQTEAVLAAVAAASERTERELRREISESARGGRQEQGQAFAALQQLLAQQSAEALRTQSVQNEAFAQQLALLQKTVADTLARERRRQDLDSVDPVGRDGGRSAGKGGERPATGRDRDLRERREANDNELLVRFVDQIGGHAGIGARKERGPGAASGAAARTGQANICTGCR